MVIFDVVLLLFLLVISIYYEKVSLTLDISLSTDPNPEMFGIIILRRKYSYTTWKVNVENNSPSSQQEAVILAGGKIIMTRHFTISVTFFDLLY